VKLPICIILAVVATNAVAQNPDVSLKFEGRFDYRIPKDAQQTLHPYDTLGRPSLLQLQFRLEPGLKAYVAQRLQRIPGDGDPELLDQYFVEDEGVWRVGKQIVPFGNGAFLRETTLAARGDIDLPIEGAQLAIAICDSGHSRQSGFAGRMSFFDGDLGFSAAIGRHWGINAGSFTYFRRPEDSPGQGAGLKQILGADLSHTFGPLRGKAELVLMSGGKTPQDPTGAALDLSIAASPSKLRTYELGWTRSPSRQDFIRIVGILQTVKNVTLEPMVRFRNGIAYDFSIQLHVKF